MQEGGLAAGKSTAAACNGWIVFEDEAGQSMTPPRATTWGGSAISPCPGSRSGLQTVSMAGMACDRPGEHSRLIYRIREYRGRKDEPKGFGWLAGLPRPDRPCPHPARRSDCAGLGQRSSHLTEPLREFTKANTGWLTVLQLPTYAPALNPQEGIWSLVKRDIGNLAAADLSQITRALKRQLKQIQYRRDLLDGCLTGTGLIMDGWLTGPNHAQRPAS
ncbi:transposase [Streptomyces sp. NPDC013457]|uniref:transposase n=1 Tax=Streptomyces sp. NPDC013457 TaxID=3364866 RepID=UPI0036FCFBA6